MGGERVTPEYLTGILLAKARLRPCSLRLKHSVWMLLIYTKYGVNRGLHALQDNGPLNRVARPYWKL